MQCVVQYHFARGGGCEGKERVILVRRQCAQATRVARRLERLNDFHCLQLKNLQLGLQHDYDPAAVQAHGQNGGDKVEFADRFTRFGVEYLELARGHCWRLSAAHERDERGAVQHLGNANAASRRDMRGAKRVAVVDPIAVARTNTYERRFLVKVDEQHVLVTFTIAPERHFRRLTLFFRAVPTIGAIHAKMAEGGLSVGRGAQRGLDSWY